MTGGEGGTCGIPPSPPIIAWQSTHRGDHREPSEPEQAFIELRTPAISEMVSVLWRVSCKHYWGK